jgi:hypothetical protein
MSVPQYDAACRVALEYQLSNTVVVEPAMTIAPHVQEEHIGLMMKLDATDHFRMIVYPDGNTRLHIYVQ